MRRSKINRAGIWVLAAGILMLLTGLLLTMTVGTVLVPILISGSVLVNSTGITLILHGREPKPKNKSNKTNDKKNNDPKGGSGKRDRK